MAGIRASIQAELDTSKVDMQFNKMMSRLSGKQINFNVNSRSFTQPLGRITASSNEFTKSLEASNARVIAFGASVGIINAVSNAFKGLVAETIKFEKTLADINVIMNASTASIEKFGHSLFDVAKNTAQSFDKVASAALEFSRQGLSMEETLRRTNDALILTRLTSLKAEEAVAGLTAAVNAFGGAGLTTTAIIDKLAAVDVKFAVSSEDLINALERTGAVAIDAGVELDNLIGLVTALQQTTARGGSVIGNGLKTIFTRIQRPDSIRQLEDMNIAVRDLTGAILPADTILSNIAKNFDRLSQAQQSNVVQFAAGIFQANVFRASLRDLAKEQGIYTQASKISATAAGEAALKNEQLNKTVSALASQSGTAISELAEVIGKLTLNPELGGMLQSFLSVVTGFKDALGGGEEEGSTFAKGLVRGIGNVLTGPALFAFGAVFIKMLANVSKFASQSLKDVLGITTRKEKIRQMEKSIVDVLSENKHIQEGLNELEGDRLAQEKFLLKIIEAQTNAMEKQKALAASLAGPLLKSGVNPNLTSSRQGPIDLDGDGRIDSFASGAIPSRREKAAEISGAISGGYAPGSVRKMNMPGLGRVVYNTAEKVKKFPGMDQPAIMPPRSSKAGKKYKDAFSSQHGFDPYAHHGFVPNFATKVGNKLQLEKSKFKLFGNAMDIGRAVGVNYKEIEKHFQDKTPITANATLQEIILSSDAKKTKITGKETLFDVFNALSGAGIDNIERDFDVRPIAPGRRGQGNLSNEEFAERKSVNLLNQEQRLNEEKPSHRLTYDPKTKKGVQNYPVDIIAFGDRFPSHEVKSGKLSAANLISKSLRMASDKSLITWLADNKITGGKALKAKNLNNAKELASKMGISGSGKDGEFTQEDADQWGMSNGFVPNFGYMPLRQTKNGKNYVWEKDLRIAKISYPRAEFKQWDKNPKMYFVSGDISRGPTQEEVERDILRFSDERRVKEFGRFAASKGYPQVYAAWQKGITTEKVVSGYGRNYDRVAGKTKQVLPKQLSIKQLQKISIGDLNDYMLQDLYGSESFDNVGKTYSSDLVKKPSGTRKVRLGSSEIEAGTYKRGDLLPDTAYNPIAENTVKQLYSEFKNKYGASQGFVPNFGDLIKFERNKILAATPMHMEYFKSFQEGETEWRSGKSMKEFLTSLYDDYKDQFQSMQEWKNALDGLQRGDIDVGMLKGSMSRHKNNMKNMSGGYVPNFKTKDWNSVYREFKKNQKQLQEKYDFAQILGIKAHANVFPKDISKAKSDRNSRIAYSDQGLGEKRYTEMWNHYHGLEHANIIYDFNQVYQNLKTGKYQNRKEFNNYFGSRETANSYMSGANKSTAKRQLGSNFDDFVQRAQALPGGNVKGGGRKAVFIKGDAFEKLIVNEAFNRTYRKGPASIDLRNIESQYFNKRNKELFDIEGVYRHGDPFYGREEGHGDVGTLFKLAKDEATKKQVDRKVEGFLNQYQNKKGPKPKKVDLGHFDFADMIGGSGKLGKETETGFVEKSFGVIEGLRGHKKESYAPGAISKLPDGSKISYSYTKDFIKLPDNQAAFIESIKQGQDIPSSEELIKGELITGRRGFDVAGLSRGFIPNFANPLDKAISREMNAGIPAGMIRIDQSDKLKGPLNPDGIAVINTRDEPMGVDQGIARARKLGLDPKKHGASGGLIPNFEDPTFRQPRVRLKSTKEGLDPGVVKDIENSLRKYNEALEEGTSIVEDRSQGDFEGLQKLFYFQSAISMANGFLEQFSTSSNVAVKKLAEFGMGLSDTAAAFVQAKTMVPELMEALNVNTDERMTLRELLPGGSADSETQNARRKTEAKIKEDLDRKAAKKGGKLSPIDNLLSKLGKTGRIFGRFLPVLGNLYAGFTAFNEAIKFVTGEGIFDHMASSADKAAKRLEELAKASDTLQASIDANNAVQNNQTKIAELETLGKGRTIAQDRELYKLQTESYGLRRKQAKAARELYDESIVGASGLRAVEETLGEFRAATTITTEELMRAQRRIAQDSLNEQRIIDIEKSVQSDTASLSEKKGSVGQVGFDTGLSLRNFFADRQDMTDTQKNEAQEKLNKEITGLMQQISVMGTKGKSPLGSSMQGVSDPAAIIKASGLPERVKELLLNTEGTVDGMGWIAEIGLNPEELKIFQGYMRKLNEGLNKSDAQKNFEAIAQSTGEAKRQLDRLLVSTKHRADMAEIAANFERDMLQVGRDRQGSEDKFLREQKSISEISSIQRETARKALDQDAAFQKAKQAVNKKSLDALRDQAGKNLQVSNITLTNDAGTFEEKAKEFIGKTQSLGDGDTLKAAMDKFNAGAEAGAKISKEEMEAGAKLIKEKFQNINIDELQGKELQAHLNTIFAELARENDSRVVVAAQLALSEADALKVSEDTKKEMRKILLEEEKGLKEAENSNKIAKEKLKLENEEKILNSRTIEGAKAKLKILRQSPVTQGLINLELMGEAANLKVINDHHARRIEFLRGSAVFEEQIFEQLRDRARQDAESGMGNLASAQREVSLRGADPSTLSKEELEVQKNLIDAAESKIRQEITGAQLAAEDAELRNQILSSHTASKKIASANLKTETFNLQTDIGLKKAKLDLLQDEVTRSELVSAMVSNEMLDSKISLDILSERIKFLGQGKNRSKLAGIQNKIEIKELQLNTSLTEEKLKQLQSSGELSKLAAGQIDSELATLRYDNAIAEEKLKQLINNGKISELASERLRSEITQKGTDLAYTQAKLKLLQDEEKRAEFVSLTVRNEMADQELSLELLTARGEFLDKAKNRAKLADLQNKTELETLNQDNKLQAEKLQQLIQNKEIAKIAEAQVTQATLSLERDALIAAAKQKVLDSTLGLEERQRKAQELLDISNKMQEARNAKNAANIDQGLLGAMVGADINIERSNKFRGTREAATRASITGKPKDVLAFAQAMRDFKDSTDEGASALDEFRVYMAEVSVEANKSGQAMIAGFEAARQGMKQALKDISTGQMSAGDALEGVLLQSLGAAFDKITEQNVDKFMGQIMFGLTGVNPEEDAKKATQNNTEALKKLTEQLDGSMKDLDGFRGQREAEVKSNFPIPGTTETTPSTPAPPTNVNKNLESNIIQARNGPMQDNAGRMAGQAAGICNCLDKAMQDNVSSQKSMKDDIAKQIQSSQPAQTEPTGELIKQGLNQQSGEISKLSSTMGQGIKQMGGGIADAIKQMGSMNPGGAAASLISGVGGGALNLLGGLGSALFSGVGKIGGAIGGLFGGKSGGGAAGKFYGGKIQRFNTGGLVQGPGGIDNVPAMLSAGEYVMSKQEVARATNLNNIQKARQNSARMDQKLYGDNIQKFNQGGKLNEWAGGVLDNMGMNRPGKGNSSGFERSTSLVSGLAGLGVQSAVANYVGKKYGPGQRQDPNDKPPEFDKTRLEVLNGGMGSTVSLGMGDSRLSGRFVSENQHIQDYGSHLLDVHEYNVAKQNAATNAKLEKYKGFISKALGMVASSALANIGSIGGAIGGLVGKAGGMLGGGLSKIGGGLGKLGGVGKFLGSGISGVGGAIGSLGSGIGGGIGALSNFNLSGAVSSLGSGAIGATSSLTGGASGSLSTIPGIGGALGAGVNTVGGMATGAMAGVSGATSSITDTLTGRRSLTSGMKGVGSSITGGAKAALSTTDKWRDKLNYKFTGGQIPAMLTKGESVIPAPIAQRMGYSNLSKINQTGQLPIVDGPGGIDNVGPVGMNAGDFVIKRSSTDKLLKRNPFMMKMALQNPEVFRKGGMVKGYYNGGVVGGSMATSATPQNYSNMGGGATAMQPANPQVEKTSNREAGATTNNINISVKIDQSGQEKVSTDAQGNDYQKEQELSMKIKTAVLQVIREEKRIGGELS